MEIQNFNKANCRVKCAESNTKNRIALPSKLTPKKGVAVKKVELFRSACQSYAYALEALC